MFVKLFIETDADDQLADVQDTQRHARPAARGRPGAADQPGS
jgi:hypothetical protein